MTTPTPLYLICHKVRGERAYDVAIRMECPCCNDYHVDECIECDALGYWWIIPTSGHRAHPVADYPLSDLVLALSNATEWGHDTAVIDLPTLDLATVDDHYQIAFAPRGAATDTRPEFLRALLRKSQVTINRRGL